MSSTADDHAHTFATKPSINNLDAKKECNRLKGSVPIGKDLYYVKFDRDEDRRLWTQLNCLTLFHLEVDFNFLLGQDELPKRGQPTSHLPPSESPPPESPPPESPPPESPPIKSTPPPQQSTQTQRSQSSLADHSYDPHWGKHWTNDYLSFDDLHTRHNTQTASAGGIPASVTTIFDGQNDAINANEVLMTADGRCPPSSKAYKCCPAQNPMAAWGNTRNPVVAITTGVTTRNIGEADLHPGHLALFIRLMPTIINTYDCDIDYMLVLGFDKGDRFYDTKEGQAEIEAWLTENMAKPFAEAGIRIKFMFVEVQNDLQKPGPVFNSMLQQAYLGGADYFYRLNDDSELKHHGRLGAGTSWPKVFIGALSQWGPPSYGVIGPTGGLPQIMTHDFVHRAHMEIFEGEYYPTQLVDWWMDDWISHVYGRRRTIKSTEYEVEHHTTHHGQRYKVDKNNQRHLRRLIREGSVKIGQYEEARGGGKMSEWANDASGPPFQDLPCGEFTGLECNRRLQTN